jgi:hypothetical protein
MSNKNDLPGFTLDGIASQRPSPDIDDDRRRFLKGALIAGSGAVAAPGLIGSAEAQTQTPPVTAAGDGRKNHRNDTLLDLMACPHLCRFDASIAQTWSAHRDLTLEIVP